MLELHVQTGIMNMSLINIIDSTFEPIVGTYLRGIDTLS